MAKALLSNRTLRLLRRTAMRAMQDAITLPVGSTLPAGAILADGTVLTQETTVTVQTAVLGSFSIRRGGGDTEQQGDLIVERGPYAADFPLGTVLAPGETVLYAGRVFTVVWTPPPTTFDVAHSYGLTEVR
jgi:hypothetical protein